MLGAVDKVHLAKILSCGPKAIKSHPRDGYGIDTIFAAPRMTYGSSLVNGIDPSPSMGEGLGGGEHRRNEHAKAQNRLSPITFLQTGEAAAASPPP